MRCFIAIDLDKKAKEELSKVQEEIERENKDKMKANFVNPDILHLTLRFLGEIDDARVNRIKEILKQLKIEKFNARLNGLGVFPSSNFIRVVWVGLEPKQKFIEIHNMIDTELEKLKMKRDERFESHVTLARIKWLQDKRKFLEKLKKIKVNPIEFCVDSIKLKKSTLTKEGPIYEDIFCLQLL